MASLSGWDKKRRVPYRIHHTPKNDNKLEHPNSSMDERSNTNKFGDGQGRGPDDEFFFIYIPRKRGELTYTVRNILTHLQVGFFFPFNSRDSCSNWTTLRLFDRLLPKLNGLSFQEMTPLLDDDASLNNPTNNNSLEDGTIVFSRRGKATD
eukprot:scaffold1426_cov83-Cylindrotheca_fusiformis.AAC.16